MCCRESLGYSILPGILDLGAVFKLFINLVSIDLYIIKLILYLFLSYLYICLHAVQSRHFVGQSKNSYFERFDSGIVLAQSRNRDKVRIYYLPCAK